MGGSERVSPQRGHKQKPECSKTGTNGRRGAKPYTPEDIRKLFALATYLTAGLRQASKTAALDSGSEASRFWIPLLGLFTGARLEELAQLHLDDIVLVDRQRNRRRVFALGQPAPSGEGLAATLAEAKEKGETLCIFINKGKEYQRLKNKPSRRYIPLSSALVDDLGFLGYVAAVFHAAEEAQQTGSAAKDNGRLFPELRKTGGADKYGHKLSHWYAEYRQRVGVVGGEDGEGKKVFHSFRHTISDWCLQQTDIPDTAAISYLGHKQESITFDIYAKGTLPHVLYDSITERFTESARSLWILKASKAAGGREGEEQKQEEGALETAETAGYDPTPTMLSIGDHLRKSGG